MKELNDTLHLFLKGKWYDMIASGAKKVEYRRICDYWNSRLLAIDEKDRIVYRSYNSVIFHRGYTSTIMKWKVDRITVGYGDPCLGAPPDKKVYKIGCQVCAHNSIQFFG